MKKQFVISLFIFLFLVGATAIVVIFGKGYRFGFDKSKIQLAGTGLLVAKSNPDGASVFVNGHLTTATDNTINLFPGEYAIRIYKEGYFPWEKKIKIQQEVVAQADALLFPTAPKLESITASGVENPTIDPSQTRLAFTVASQSALKNGVYVLDMSSRSILTLQSSSTQLVNDTADTFSKAGLARSPDGKQLVATISAATTYLLNANDFNQSPVDATATLINVQNTWQKDKAEKDEARVSTLKSSLKTMITKNFSIIAWSPDETKILYQASTSATLPIIITPRLIGVDTTPEERTIKEKMVYVYDTKEDKNFKIDVDPSLLQNTSSPPLRWFSDSRHLIFVHDKKIDIMDYDATNVTTIYAGPFVDNYVFPWPNGSKMVILTNLGNPTILPNLYTISLK